MTVIYYIIGFFVAIWKLLVYGYRIAKAWAHYFWSKKVLKLKFSYNPFVKYPRNDPCYCGSGLKYKKCCLHNEPEAIRADIADKVSKLVKRARAKRK